MAQNTIPVSLVIAALVDLNLVLKPCLNIVHDVHMNPDSNTFNSTHLSTPFIWFHSSHTIWTASFHSATLMLWTNFTILLQQFSFPNSSHINLKHKNKLPSIHSGRLWQLTPPNSPPKPQQSATNRTAQWQFYNYLVSTVCLRFWVQEIPDSFLHHRVTQS